MNEQLEELIRLSAKRDPDHPGYKFCGEGIRTQYEAARKEAIEKGLPGFTIFFMHEELISKNHIEISFKKAVFSV